MKPLNIKLYPIQGDQEEAGHKKPKDETLDCSHMSDGERIEEYAYTGTPEYLTVELASKMRVSPEVMQQVPGATEIDVESAEVWWQESEDDFEKQEQEFLQKYGMDDVHINELCEQGSDIYLQHLLDVASPGVSFESRDGQDEDRDAADFARHMLEGYVVQFDNGVKELFSVVRYESASGIRDVQIIRDVFKKIHSRFVILSHDTEVSDEDIFQGEKYANVLNNFSRISDDFLESSEPPGSINYLVDRYLHNFFLEQKFTEADVINNSGIEFADEMVGLERLADFDRDIMVPFEITDGKLALFGADKTVLYLSDEEYSKEMQLKFEELVSQISYSVEGQHFARRVVADIPYELEYETSHFIDASSQLGRDEGTSSMFNSKDQLRDYLYLLQANMREAIENDFSIELKKISLREQLYFLTYLQHTTVSEVDTMQNFTRQHDLEGMRTFLSLERGAGDLGDKIVEFGQHEEVANKVFAYYSELLDIAERAEELVKEKTDCEGEMCIQQTNQVRENILNRAQKDLEKAVRADDVRDIEALLNTYVADAKKEVAFLQEFGLDNTEPINSVKLTDEDKDQMLVLLDQNYQAAYGGEENVEFRETIKGSLGKSFDNPNTEFHIVRDKEKIISFNRFDLQKNNHGHSISYFGSFNADPVYSGVGSVMLEQTIQQQLEKCDVMYAHCDPTSDIAKKYIESGFVAKETETVAGKFSFEIWRTKDITEHLKSKTLSTEALLEGSYQGETIVVREVEENDTFDELDEGLGYLLTRYFNQGNKTYAVFEIPSPTLWNQFKS